MILKFFKSFFDKEYLRNLLHFFSIGLLFFVSSNLGVAFNRSYPVVDVNEISIQLTNGISAFTFTLAMFCIDLFFVILFSIIFRLLRRK